LRIVTAIPSQDALTDKAGAYIRNKMRVLDAEGAMNRRSRTMRVHSYLDSPTGPSHYAFVILMVCATNADPTFKA
jgi:hypothetical protein